MTNGGRRNGNGGGIRVPFGQWLRLVLVSFVVTTLFFTVEALMHYNIGKTGKIGLSEVPPFREQLEMVGTVMIFSALSAFASEWIQKRMYPLPAECTMRPELPRSVEELRDEVGEVARKGADEMRSTVGLVAIPPVYRNGVVGSRGRAGKSKKKR